MTVDEAIKQVAINMNLDECVVRRAYYSMFEFIKDTVIELPLKEEFLSREDLGELKKVFYMPILGKIDVPYSRYKKVWNVYLNKGKNKNKDVQAQED